jgi:hypothetical protein
MLKQMGLASCRGRARRCWSAPLLQLLVGVPYTSPNAACSWGCLHQTPGGGHSGGGSGAGGRPVRSLL